MTAYNALTRNMNVDELLNAAERETITPGSAVAELVRYVREVQATLEHVQKIEDELHGPFEDFAADIDQIIARENYAQSLMTELVIDSVDDMPDTERVAEIWNSYDEDQRMADYTAELMDELDCRDVDNLPRPAGIVAALDDAEPSE